MSNKTIALKLSELQQAPDEADYYYNPEKCKIYDSVMKALEWKDSQIAEALDRLNHNAFYNHEECIKHLKNFLNIK